ncbi:Sec-independent protein translocase protein TatB [Labrys sp. KB_33_2]|uniref:Sec-independent protein translocase protein TatB n=1 Tax=unclassified Labrys (in: a-proteobacteria) TaxID=2688601 RepID=UPI003EBAA48E
MFDISWSHILIVGAVAVVVIGPKELPSTMRSLGRGVNKLRRMAGEFQGQFNEALKEANLEDVKKEFDTLRQSAATLSSIGSPAGLARNALKSSVFDSEPPLSPAAIAPVLDATASEPSIAGPSSSPLASKLVGVEIPSAFAPLAAFKS